MTTTQLTVVVDASVLVGALVPHDPHYIVSRRWLNRWSADGNRLCAPVLVLAEVAGAVARRTGDPARGLRALGRVQRIPQLRLVLPDEGSSVDAANIAATLSLRGADAVYVALAQQLSLPLVTWDQEQLSRAASVVQTRTP